MRRAVWMRVYFILHVKSGSDLGWHGSADLSLRVRGAGHLLWRHARGPIRNEADLFRTTAAGKSEVSTQCDVTDDFFRYAVVQNRLYSSREAQKRL